jgi:hypothetical protein
MAQLREDVELRASDPLMHEPGHARIGADITVAGGDQRRRPNLGEAFGEIARRKDPVGRGVGGGIIAATAFRVSGDHLWVRAAKFLGEPAAHLILEMLPRYAVGNDGQPLENAALFLLGTPGDRAEQDQPIKLVRVRQRKALGDQAAQGEAHQMAAPDIEPIEQRPQIHDEIVELVGALRRARLAVAAQVLAQRTKPAVQRGHHALPLFQRASHTMHEDQHPPLAR